MAKRKGTRQQWDSERVYTLRRHLGLTQGEMAAELGTRQQTISDWEKGKYQPRGTSATVLSIIAERSRFKYEASPQNEDKKTQNRDSS